MNKEDYQEYRLSEKWRKKREKCMQQNDYRCQVCGCTWWRREVDVHHLHYRNVGNEEPEDLVPLCVKHHKMIHESGDYDMNGLRSLQDSNKENNWQDPLPKHVREKEFYHTAGTSFSDLLRLRDMGEMVDNADLESAKNQLNIFYEDKGFEKVIEILAKSETWRFHNDYSEKPCTE